MKKGTLARLAKGSRASWAKPGDPIYKRGLFITTKGSRQQPQSEVPTERALPHHYPLVDAPLSDMVESQLEGVQRCTGVVVIASPKYGDPSIHCEIRVDPLQLKDWMVDRFERTIFYDEYESAKAAMSEWLSNANENATAPSYLPESFYRVIHLYLIDFFKKPDVDLICFECGCSVSEAIEKSSGGLVGNLMLGVDQWVCPEGHTLYEQKRRGHLFMHRPVDESQ